MKRVLVWIAPALALAAVVGTFGYRALAHRRTRSTGQADEGAVSVAQAEVRRFVAHPSLLRTKLHGTPLPSAARRLTSAAPPMEPAFASTPPERRATTAPIQKPEEAAIRRKLEPLVAGRKDTDLPFVVCEPYSAPPADETGEEPSALDRAPRDPAQPVCRARVQARDRDTLVQVVREASSLYGGHLAVEVREHMTAFTGVWYEADLRVDTDDAQSLPSEL
jgi:hypothetical protein